MYTGSGCEWFTASRPADGGRGDGRSAYSKLDKIHQRYHCVARERTCLAPTTDWVGASLLM